MDPSLLSGLPQMPQPHEMYFKIGLVIFLIAFIWWSSSGYIATFARRKGRSWNAMFIVGIVASPLISGTITASIATVYHPDEHVDCPTCASRIHFNASKCSECGQLLTPNRSIGEGIVGETERWDNRIKWIPLGVTILGAIWVLYGLIQDDAKLMESFGQLLLGWLILGIAAALWVVKYLRTKLARELYFGLLGGS